MKVALLAVVVTVLSFLPSLTAQSSPVLPSYFPPGIQKITDPLKQRAAMMRMYIGTQHCYQASSEEGQFARFIPSPDSLTVQTDVVSTSSVTENPAKLKVVLDNYVPLANDSVQVTTLCDQHIITAAQAAADGADLVAVVKEPAQADFDYYKVTIDLALTYRADNIR